MLSWRGLRILAAPVDRTSNRTRFFYRDGFTRQGLVYRHLEVVPLYLLRIAWAVVDGPMIDQFAGFVKKIAFGCPACTKSIGENAFFVQRIIPVITLRLCISPHLFKRITTIPVAFIRIEQH